MSAKLLIEETHDPARWDEYVARCRHSHSYHQFGWKRVIEASFGHRTHYLSAIRDGQVAGVLPLVHMKSRLFGSFLISMPYLNYGGILAEDDGEAAAALFSHAGSLARDLGAAYLELRHAQRLTLPSENKFHKVTMLLDLPSDPDELWSAFKSKLRSQIKRPMKEGLEARVGGEEELDGFYGVFARNMRDLGTPVYSKQFFANILKQFPEEAVISSVYLGDHVIASGFLIGYRGIMEIPWASSLREYNRLSANMLMYWNALRHACESGFTRFDFGRSTPGEGTYKFKEQWGAAPSPLCWQYHLPNGAEMPDLSPANPKYELAIKIWTRLPLAVTKIVGPSIVKNIP